MTGLQGLIKRRAVLAALHSWRGLKACFEHEEAFRIEVLLSVFLLPAAFFVADNAIELILLCGSVLLVLIVELLNSAVEAAIDRIGPEHHALSGRAKDLGSAAVLMAMALFVVTWAAILLY
ncbi:MAG: diacylglycerol kinase [Porticoccaceae bacterium]